MGASGAHAPGSPSWPTRTIGTPLPLPARLRRATRAQLFQVLPDLVLVEPCVRAGTSEKGACPRCGAPWARVVAPGGLEANGSTEAIWKPTCACPTAAPVPCVVLDPFAGTGTVLAAAVRLGRRAVGCELNEGFAHFGQRRVVGAVGAEGVG
jgi:hypothetical protein